MAELVYAFDLKSNGEIHMGSSPISGTSLLKLRSLSDFFTYFFDLTPRRFYYLFILIMLRLSQYVHIKKTKKQKNSIGGGVLLYTRIKNPCH